MRRNVCNKKLDNSKQKNNSNLLSRFIVIPVGLILAIFAVIVIGTFINPSKTYAKTADTMNPTESAKSYVYYQALSFCIDKYALPDGAIGFNNRINETNALAGTWFVNPPVKISGSPTLAYFLSSKGLKIYDDTVDCGGNNQDWVMDAWKLWGYSNGVDALCDTGAQRANGSDCRDGSGDFKGSGGILYNKLSVTTFQNNIKTRVYGGSEPVLTDAAKYVLYRDSFLTGCNGDNPVYPGTANDEYTYSLQLVDSHGSGPFVTRYYGTKKASDEIKFYMVNGNNIKETCGNIVAVINSGNIYKAYQEAVKTPAPGVIIDPEVPVGTVAKTTTCAIEGVGWILCPVINLMGNIIDKSWGVIEGFLKTDIKIVSTDGSTYSAWKVMQGIANVAFVIAFLIIIFSQITSFGIANYGIKKMLPKLIIAAILVNISFYICQLAVDISNISGSSIKGMLDGLSSGVFQPNFGSSTSGVGIIAGVIGAGVGIGVLFASLGTLIPVLLAGIVAVVMILFILIARQAIIVMLIVISPLAFVAFLLPNTEKLFKTWQKTFTSMLLLYPIVAFVMGASSLAATILTGVFSDVTNPSNSTLGQIAVAAVAILPLFIIPGLLKKSLDGIGSLGNKINGLSDKWGKSAGSKYTNSSFAKYQKSKKDTDSSLTAAGSYTGKNPFKRVSSGIHGGINRNSLLNKVNRGYGNSQSAAGLKLAEAQSESEITAASSQLKFARLDKFQTRDLALGKQIKYKDATGKEISLDASKNANLKYAAMRSVVNTNDVKGINDLWDEASTWAGPEGANRRTVFADSLQTASGRPAYLGQGAIAKMRTGTPSAPHDNIETTIVAAVKANTYSASKIANADQDELNKVAEIAHSSTALSGTPELAKLKANANDALTDPILKHSVSKNIANATNIHTGTAPTPLL